jgi:hypothetical protein
VVLLTANLTITTPLGNTLTVTGYDSGTGVISYSYTLNDNTTTHSAATGEDSVFENLAVVLHDVDGDEATGTLSAAIVDDVPTAKTTRQRRQPGHDRRQCDHRDEHQLGRGRRGCAGRRRRHRDQVGRLRDD